MSEKVDYPIDFDLDIDENGNLVRIRDGRIWSDAECREFYRKRCEAYEITPPKGRKAAKGR